MTSAICCAVWKLGVLSSSAVTPFTRVTGRDGVGEDAAAGQRAHGRHVHAGRVAVRAAGKAADQQRPLRLRIHHAVAAAQRRRQQHAAGQRGRIAHGRDGDIDMLPGMREGRHLGGHHHGGDIVRLHGGHVRQRDAHIAQHVEDGLLGIGHLGRLVARARQADDEPIAVKLVGRRAGHRHQLADRRGIGRAGSASSSAARLAPRREHLARAKRSTAARHDAERIKTARPWTGLAAAMAPDARR